MANVKPGEFVLYMKVGIHAKESLEDIIVRKQREIQDEGFAMWGYGGNTCHPKAVRPFAEDVIGAGKTIVVCMHPMNSNHFAEPVRAEEYSINGVDWQEVPKGINVRGSRFALAIKKLEASEFQLPLEDTRVAIGNCLGRRGDAYVKGRVDKACLQVIDGEPTPAVDPAKDGYIGLTAELVAPYAVMLRNVT